MKRLATLILCACAIAQAREAITTPIPRLNVHWRASTAGTTGTDADARKIAETARTHVQSLPDPFTPLAQLSCAERRQRSERILWEDAALMALADRFDEGAVLVVPKSPRNFLFDLTDAETAHLARVAAATCDALVMAAGRRPSATLGQCSIYVNPPAGLSVRQLHVHVLATPRPAAGMNDEYTRKSAAHLARLLGSRGCL